MSYKNLLFDLDGTLTDSGEGIMQSGIYALKKLGLEVPDTHILRKMVGPPLGTSFKAFGVPEERIEEAIVYYRENYIGNGAKYLNHVYPGVEKMLMILKNEGFRLYVATSKPEELAKDILHKFELDSYFDYIAGATVDHSRESKSDVVKYVLEMINDTDNTVMIGDTKFDVIGASQQHIPCIGVSWGYGGSEELIEAGAIRITDCTEQLTAYLLENR